MVGNSGLSRRSFLALSAAAVAGPALLAGCSDDTSAGGGGGGGSTAPLKFWNMPWGSPAFNTLDQKITEAYRPAEGSPPMTYQVIQWANFTQTFASAVASKTNPAVSSGGGTQVFQFEDQGGIEYLDEMYATWKENGLYEDFLPGLIDNHTHLSMPFGGSRPDDAPHLRVRDRRRRRRLHRTARAGLLDDQQRGWALR